MPDSTSPVTIFGIPAKPVLFFTIIAGIVLTDVDFHRLIESSGNLPVIRKHGTDAEQTGPPGTRDIVATPEMIDRARQKIEAARREERENAHHDAATDRYYYIIELYSGGDIESAELTIHPDRIVLTSASGITTVIDRRSVRNIHRIKLPPEGP